MSELNKSYRIRTNVSDGGSDDVGVVNVHLDQTYDMLEILSLKLDQKNEYKYYEGDYGCLVGRVYANGGFGITNAKVSVFIPVDDTDSLKQRLNYNFASTSDSDNDGVRYNLLPDSVDSACHQDVGTFPSKRYMLDNDDVIETFEKYWKYTTTTNTAGDYMIFGIPTGSQKVHVDVDLSDCGLLSQKPSDMTYKGYPAKMFDSPTKFKKSSDLNSLAQIYSQDKGVYVYPYWGETSMADGDNLAITRCDIQLEYKFEPTCVFIGSVVTDKGNNAIGKNCAGTDSVGKMSDLSAGEGTIEMIRKTLDNKVEVYQIQGDRLIDGDGVWCYQIPMNLDYVKTDEFGNLVPTDDPDKGIPTRTRVRFRISLDEQPSDGSARKRCRYLVPNNPRLDDEGFQQTLEADYEFGSATREESFVDMFWNKVYTVKSYIPRFQKNSKVTNKKFTGIKLINHYGDNNPLPYNSLSIKLSFTFRLICVITKIIIYIIAFINTLLSLISTPFCWLKKILKKVRIKILGVCVTCPIVDPLITLCDMLIFNCIELSSEFCDDGINQRTYYPGCNGCAWDETEAEHNKSQQGKPTEDWTIADNKPQLFSGSDESYLFTCVENSLAQENDCTSFNFYNDWVNGVLYMPLWYRKITPKKSFLFGLFKRKAKDQWCDANKTSNGARLFYPCSVPNNKETGTYRNYDGVNVKAYRMSDGGCGDSCHETTKQIGLDQGVILTRMTLTGSTVYYYKAVEYDNRNITSCTKEDYYGDLTDIKGKKIDGEIKLLFATDIVLLGSLNSCDLNGVPQFFKKLDNTTYNLPTDILFTDMTWSNSVDENGDVVVDDDGDPQYQASLNTEMTGCDWGNLNTTDECGKMGKDDDSGLFYSIGCSTIEMKSKSCINMKRICEYGVSLDDTKYVPNLSKLSGDSSDSSYDLLIPDGFISYDELYNLDERSMFATMNGNKLKTKLNTTNGLREYDFRYLYPEAFDGSLTELMKSDLGSCSDYTYGLNYNLEAFSQDYYRFRMGDKPYFYDNDGDKRFPRYENSFYFYFGLKYGKTAIDKFHSQFFAECEDTSAQYSSIAVSSIPNTWCSELKGEYDGSISIDLTGISTPYDIIINSDDNSSLGYEFDGIEYEKICLSDDAVEGYENLKDENGNNVKMLPNGSYTLTVTDSEGNISSVSFTTEAKYLSFDVSTVNFQQAENILKELYNNGQESGKYTAIAKSGKQLTLNSDNTASRLDTTNEEIGGTITVYNISYDNEQLKSSEITVTVEPVTEDDNYDKTVYPYSMQGSVNTAVSKWNGNDTYMAKVGKGDTRYKVTVTQLCDGIESNNSITKTVTISNPISFEMYINGVDSNLLQNEDGTYWETGYSHSSANKVNTNGKSPEKWLSLSKYTTYNWNNSREFVEFTTALGMSDVVIDDNGLAGYKSNGTTVTNTEVAAILGNYLSELPDILVETVNKRPTTIANDMLWTAVNAYMNNVISMAKRTFWLTCPKEEKDITISAKTSDFPLSFKTCYQEEEYDNENEVNKLTSSDLKYNASQQIGGVMIPTITTDDNEWFASSVKIPGSDGLVYGKDNINNYMRKPFFVAVANGKKKTIPFKVGADDNGAPAENLGEYLGFHLVDKTLKSDFMTWSYIHSVPFFCPTVKDPDDTSKLIEDDTKAGVTITTNGLFTGYIYNGIMSASGDFDEQLLGGKNLEIKSIDIEDAVPTRRIIVGVNNGEYRSFDNTDDEDNWKYYYDGDADETKYTSLHHYASVRDGQLDVSIRGDDSCSIDDTAYGNMNITLLDSSIDHYEKGSTLAVSCGVSGTNVTYYIFQTTIETQKAASDDEEEVYSCDYPLNYFNVVPENDGDTTYYIRVDCGNRWGDEDRSLFSYKTTTDDFMDKCQSQLMSQTLGTDGTSLALSYGYGTTGSFSISKNTIASLFFGSTAKSLEGCFYIIAVTENDCRCISPVYDFRHINVTISFKEDGNNKVVMFNIVDPKKRYYIKNFTFDASVEITTEVPFNGSITMTKEDLDITDPADDGWEEGDDIEEWLKNNGDKSKLYSFEGTSGGDGGDGGTSGDGGETTTVYDIYEFVDNWVLSEDKIAAADVEAEYVDLPTLEEGKIGFKYQENTDEDGTWHTIASSDLTASPIVWDVIDEEGTSEDPGEDYQLLENVDVESGEYVKYKIFVGSEVPETNDTGEEGGDGSGEEPTPTAVDYYRTLEYCEEWRITSTLDENPLIPHYTKNIPFIVTDSTYNALSKLKGAIKTLRNKVKLTITDVTGLQHVCYITKVTEPKDDGTKTNA